jgi:excisionase family DNA binding protein
LTKKPDIDPILLKPATVAKMLDCSRPYIYRLGKEGLLPTVKWALKGSETIRFHRDDVMAFIEKHRRKI